MCLLIVISGVVPGLPLIVAANRDERRDRPAIPMTRLDGAAADWPSAVGATRSAVARGWRPTRPVSSPGSPIGRCATAPTPPSGPAASCPSRSPAIRTAAAAVDAFGTAIDPGAYNPSWLLVADRHDVFFVDVTGHRRGRRRAPADRGCTCSRTATSTSRPRRPSGCASCSVPALDGPPHRAARAPADAARRPRDPTRRATGRCQQPSPRPGRTCHLRPCRRGRLRHPFVRHHHRRRPPRPADHPLDRRRAVPRPMGPVGVPLDGSAGRRGARLRRGSVVVRSASPHMSSTTYAVTREPGRRRDSSRP